MGADRVEGSAGGAYGQVGCRGETWGHLGFSILWNRDIVFLMGIKENRCDGWILLVATCLPSGLGGAQCGVRSSSKLHHVSGYNRRKASIRVLIRVRPPGLCKDSL